jgi:hypothetical protein
VIDHIDAALHFERLAQDEGRPEKRARLLTVTREFRFLAMAEAKRFLGELPKRPPSPSVRRVAVAQRHV